VYFASLVSFASIASIASLAFFDEQKISFKNQPIITQIPSLSILIKFLNHTNTIFVLKLINHAGLIKKPNLLGGEMLPLISIQKINSAFCSPYAFEIGENIPMEL
jgi:hypothetical protein